MDYDQEIPGKSAILIQDLFKSYGDGPPVLRNLCMNVKTGSIYGLLGASGCGKTSLLSCIVGLQKWDSGEVFVFGKRPRTKGSGIPGDKCGYMPQDISLYERLTFREMANFYGKIYNMPQSDVDQQIKFLFGLLDLPSKNRTIGTFSGGQQRRVSLSLAMIHSPDLLILDEPTVGLDPTLRRSIWNHLYKIATTQNKTIVITTHYIEEAKCASMVGIMRNGRLLVEDTPANLLWTFECELLEEVTLKLCRADESVLQNLTDHGQLPKDNRHKVVFKSSWKKKTSDIIPNHSVGTFRMSEQFEVKIPDILETTAISSKKSIWNDLCHSLKKIIGFSLIQCLTLMRLPVFLVLLLFSPTFQGVIMFLTIGAMPREMKVGVVNEELLNWTSQCDADAIQWDHCDLTFLSCKYINEIRSKDILNLIPFNSAEDALAQVQRGELRGYLTFPENFTQYTLELFATRLFARNESIEGSRTHMYLDFSEYIASLLMVEHLYNAQSDYLRHMAESCFMNANRAKMPFQFREPVYGSLDNSYTEFLVPGLILCTVFMSVSVCTSIIYITDRKNGTLGRARVAGLKTADIFLSYILTQGSIGILQTFLWSLTCYFGFGYNVRGPIWVYILICLLIAICGGAFGLLKGILCEDEIQSFVIGIFIVPCLLLYGGLIWPLEGMSFFWKHFAYLLPTTLPTLSMRSVIVRALGITHPLVWPGVVSVVAWIVVFSTCATIAYKKLDT